MITILNSGVGNDKKIEANLATQILGTSAFFVTFCGFCTYGTFKRKSVMITGQIAMIAFLVLSGYFASVKNSVLSVAFLIAHFNTIILSVSPIYWIYAPEVLNDN